MATVQAGRRFLALIPAKGVSHAKSRLDVDPGQRRVLAASFLADAVTAASRARLVRGVVVLTPDPWLGGLAESFGAAWLRDRTSDDLNVAVREGVRRLGDAAGHVAVMVADLPALDAEDLDDALGQALDSPGGRLCVEDHGGGGSTLLASRDAPTLAPRFGDGSAARHGEDGFSLATGPLPGLRLDVDTLEDLRRAAGMPSLGAVTTRALRDLGLFEATAQVDHCRSVRSRVLAGTDRLGPRSSPRR